jgi:Holliday junction DNA helicase RuvA
MYDYIKGIFAHKLDNKGYYITVEASGIGYQLEVMERDYSILPELCEEIKVYSVLIHREDKMSLCGFLRREDRDVFNILTSVSGVGSKMALTLLNSFEVSDLVGLVLDGNYKELTRAKGVGPKLAQKIILELKDKLTNYKDTANMSCKTCQTIPTSQSIEDAQMVLYSLGYTKEEVSNGIAKAMDKLTPQSPAEDILKLVLKMY